MQIATLALMLLLPLTACSQEQATSGTGHFEGALSGAQWGADKQTFDAKFGPRPLDGSAPAANLSRPNPTDLSKVRELLEAASAEKP